VNSGETTLLDEAEQHEFSPSSYSMHCRGHLRLEGHKGDPDSEPRCPPNRGPASEGVPHGRKVGQLARDGEGGAMKLIKRLAVAVGSLAALALAGGAHLRF
jgi:hypothetical protein